MNRWQKITWIFITITTLLIIGELCFAGSLKSNSKTNEGIEDTWQGTLKISVMELRLIFKISRRSDGTFTATIDSPDEGNMGLPADEVTFTNNRLQINIEKAKAVYEGNLISDGSAIRGRWKQGPLNQPLILKRSDEIQQISRQQEPKRPYPYNEENIIYENKKAQIKLAGTLTLPRGESLFPAALLISGSGPQNRDELVFGHRPFLVLADYLTRRGVAVLRVDDRGVAESGGNFSEATSEDFASDVLAGIEFLKSHKQIDPNRVGLIGHSEGGLIAPMVAAQSQDVSFIVMMAGPGLVGEELLYLKDAITMRAQGATERIVALRRDTLERIFAVIKQEKDNLIAEKKICEIEKWQKQAKENLSKQEQQWLDSFGETSEFEEFEIQTLLSPWFRRFLTYDPKPALMKLSCPVLAIIGELDLQVAPKENLLIIEDALKASGNKNYMIKEPPKLNHLFQRAQTGAISEYSKIEETISPDILTLIGDWIIEQTGEKD